MECTAELQANLANYRESRAYLLASLPGAGFANISPPEGAFYIYANVADRTNDSLAFCDRLLNETRVALTPGVDFDSGRGAHFLRFSYCGLPEDVREAVSRLARI